MAPSKQESTTYEPSLVCKLLILGCRLLIPDRLLVRSDLSIRRSGFNLAFLDMGKAKIFWLPLNLYRLEIQDGNRILLFHLPPPVFTC